MKKILIIAMFICIFCMPMYSQLQAEIDSLFKVGNYTKAVQLTQRRDSIAAENLKKQKQCNAYLSDAQWYFNREQYGKSLDMLIKALDVEPQNETAINWKSKLTSSNNNFLKRFMVGLTAGADFLTTNYGFHVGATIKYGYYRELINVTAGVEYHLHYSYSEKYELRKGTVDLGSQITIPVAVKFNIARCSNSSRFYLGAGLEYGIRLSTLEHYPGKYYPTDSKAMESSTIAGLIQAGISMRHFDIGIYYKGYFKDIIVKPYYQYKENSRVGAKISYYF